MVDRRSVLKIGAAGMAGALVGMPAPLLAAVPADRRTLLRGAVFTDRFHESLAFADELQASRVATFTAGYDIAELWYRDGLRHLAPLAGLTDRVTLFCLEELARTAGLRVFYRVDHLIDERGNAEHNAAGPRSVMDAARKIPTSAFGREMALLASRFQLSDPPHTAPVKRTGPFAPQDKIALVSC